MSTCLPAGRVWISEISLLVLLLSFFIYTSLLQGLQHPFAKRMLHGCIFNVDSSEPLEPAECTTDRSGLPACPSHQLPIGERNNSPFPLPAGRVPQDHEKHAQLSIAKDWQEAIEEEVRRLGPPRRPSCEE